MARSNLTGKQRAFIDHYMSNGFNGVRAAEAAGYSGDYAALCVAASENLRKPKVKAEIESRMTEIAMPASEVLARISDMGRGDIRELVKLSTDELVNHPRANLVKKYKRKAKILIGGIIQEHVEIEMYDAQSALYTLGKHHGILKDGITININIELVSKAIEALEAAGLDPQETFEKIIQKAYERTPQPS